MSNGAEAGHDTSWLASCGFVQIFRTFRLAIHPTKLGLALAALILTLTWGTLLDAIWKASDRGVPAGAIAMYMAGQGPNVSETPSLDQVGVFATWAKHSAWAIESAFASIRHGNLWGVGQETGLWRMAAARTGSGSEAAAMPIGLIPCIGMVCQGTTWLVRQHVCFAVLFFMVTLGIWGLFGGAICRIAAVQFARDEKIGYAEALKFARQRYFGGFLMAPLLPLFMLLVLGVLLAIGGMFLRIPYLGDVLGSLVFFLALVGGFGAALVVVGAAAGGSLFWPTVAVEGSESLDAVSRSFNYVAATPWRAVFYGLVAAAYASICFLFVRFVASLTLVATHVAVGWGTSPFGWWRVGEGQMTKLDLLWSSPSLTQMYPPTAWPGGIESFSAGVIGLWVMLVVLLVWAFLASFYLSGSTVIYFLLRRANDAMDLEDVYVETYEEGEFLPTPEPAPAEPLVQIKRPQPAGAAPDPAGDTPEGGDGNEPAGEESSAS